MNTRTRTCRFWIRSLAVFGIAAALPLAGGPPARAQAPAPSSSDIAAGLRIYRQKADCQSCHGWAGDGEKMDTQMPDGANLRITRLTREDIVYTMTCGVPGKQMPAFDRLAYRDGRCKGISLADLKQLNLELPAPAATLQAREIEQVADFLFAKVIGKGLMTRAACVEFWGSDVEVCRAFPK